MNSGAKSLLCLVNPNSGGNRGFEIAKQLLKISLSNFDKIEVKLLEKLDSLPTAEQIQENYSSVLLAGGDGTFSSVLGNYCGSKIDFVLLPLGTGNDLAIELGIKKLWKGDLQKFLKQSFLLPSGQCQVWQAELTSTTEKTRKVSFLNYISFGWDGLVVDKFDQLRKNGSSLAGKFGPWGNRLLYLLASFRFPFYSLPAIALELDSKELKLPVKIRGLIFSNICSVMGMGRTNCQSDCADELLEICVVKSVLSYFRMLLPSSMAKKCFWRGKNFTLKFENRTLQIPVQIDGEYIGLFSGEKICLSPLDTVRIRKNL